MKTDAEKKAGCYLAIISLLLMVPSIIWKGYVLTVLWQWFMVPTFALPVLRLPAAIGVALTIHYLTYQVLFCEDPEKDSTVRTVRSLFVALVGPAFALLMGWIVNHWM